MHNFKLEDVDVHDFLARLKIRNIQDATETEIRFSCPFPGHLSGDENPSAYMNANSTAWYCHGCKRKGNAITFLSDLFNLSSYESIRSLKEYYGGAFRNPEYSLEDEINRHYAEYGKPDAEPLNYVLQKAVLSDFSLDDGSSAIYLRDRGFTPETIERFQLGYDKLSGRITIPIFDEVGRLVGFKGRALNPEDKPKYKVLGGSLYGFPRYHVGLVVFAIDKVQPEEREAIICEGELNAIAMHQIGYRNAIAAGGSTFTRVHAKKIIERFESVILYFDSDKAGYEATKTAADLLMPHMTVKVVPDHELDPADALTAFGVNPLNCRDYIRGLVSEAYGMLSLMVD